MRRGGCRRYWLCWRRVPLTLYIFLALWKNLLTYLQVFFEPLRDLSGWAEIGVKVTPLLLFALLACDVLIRFRLRWSP